MQRNAAQTAKRPGQPRKVYRKDDSWIALSFSTNVQKSIQFGIYREGLETLVFMRKLSYLQSVKSVFLKSFTTSRNFASTLMETIYSPLEFLVHIFTLGGYPVNSVFFTVLRNYIQSEFAPFRNPLITVIQMYYNLLRVPRRYSHP